jgi:maltose O-acetyltransferase
MTKSEKEKMLAGELYCADDPELQADSHRASLWIDRFNARQARAGPERWQLMAELLGSVGAEAMIRPPFHCDYGYNIHLGRQVFLNFGCIVLDVARVDIEANAQLGPAVQILTADHPRDAASRLARLEFGRPVRIGRNAWIGAGAIILPGVSIGADAVVGAGAVVTRDVPAGQTVVGSPARLAGRSGPR